MILLLSVTVALLFGGGAFLLLERDLVRMTGGTIMLSQSVNLFLMGAGLVHGRTHPGHLEEVSDPLVQALTLTAVVITLGVTALALALVLEVERTHGTIDVKEVVAAEKAADREGEGS